MSDERRMPLIDDRGQSIPFSSLNDEWAQRNHSQTLERLAERGGLAMSEAVAIIERRKWRSMPDLEARKQLDELLRPVTCSCGVCDWLAAEIAALRERCGRLVKALDDSTWLIQLYRTTEVRADDFGLISAEAILARSLGECNAHNDLQPPAGKESTDGPTVG